MCQALGQGLGQGEEQERYEPDVRDPILLLGRQPLESTYMRVIMWEVLNARGGHKGDLM